MQADVEGLIDFTIERYGQLDICCLNSGGVLDTAPVAQMTDEEWKLEIDWNLNHVFWGMRRALQHMIPRESGRHPRDVVGRGQARQAGHPRLRGHQARRQRAGEVGRRRRSARLGITVNSILPGLIETDIVRETGPASAMMMGARHATTRCSTCSPRSRRSSACNTVEEVAAVAVLLASDAARNITGCMFPVDGGTMPY